MPIVSGVYNRNLHMRSIIIDLCDLTLTLHVQEHLWSQEKLFQGHCETTVALLLQLKKSFGSKRFGSKRSKQKSGRTKNR